MHLKKSLFNKTIFKKNMTRFAPVWILYTLLVLVELVTAYTNNSSPDQCYYFTYGLMRNMPETLAIFNLGYALVVAQLLFGDMYNSRMVGALHALPVRRENWFVTNVVSGLAFSLIPTLVMALAALPMLARSIFPGAWKVAFLTMLIANLQYICCFGLAVFSAMCVGNRFTMIAGYGLLHAGAEIVFWAVNILYTPMLYGVVTPTYPANNLTPHYHMTRNFYEYTFPDSLYNLAKQRNCQWTDLTAEFTLTGQWWRLWVIAGAGILFLTAALLLYRKRNLECAGDAVAFPFLRPVFQVLCTLFVTVSSWYVLQDLGGRDTPETMKYILLAVALTVGWFIGRMLLARSTRVFGKRNWYGLGILGLVMALSLVCTHFDVLGIEERLPDPDKVERVSLGTSLTPDYPLTDKADIEKVLRLHALAIDERIDNDGLYVRGKDGTFVQVVDSNHGKYDLTQENPELAQVVNVRIYYTLKNGHTMERRYNIWSEKEAGNIGKRILSCWDIISESETTLADGTTVNGAEYAAQNIMGFTIEGKRVLRGDPELEKTAMSFLDAVKADCEAGNLVPDQRYHMGFFRSRNPVTDWEGKDRYNETDCFYVNLLGENTSWQVQVYADSVNTLRWLETHGLTEDWEVIQGQSQEWHYLWETADAAR